MTASQRCIQPYCDTLGAVDGYGRCQRCAEQMETAREALVATAPATSAPAERNVCLYTLQFHSADPDEVTAMLPQCCPAEPANFDVSEEPYCRYCGRPIECEASFPDDAEPDEPDALATSDVSSA